jgi:antirestriction protein ArdC
MSAVTDKRSDVLERLIARIEAGGLPPWRMPWIPGQGMAHLYPRNGVSGRMYRGYNRIRLMIEGRTDMRWYTWRQVQGLGARVRRGEHATHIEFWSPTPARKASVEGEEATNDNGYRWFGKSYSVFCADQLEGWQPPVVADLTLQPLPVPAELDAWRAGLMEQAGLVIVHGAQASYSPRLDRVMMPDVAEFESIPAYYATLCHEVVHWSGHTSRLDRFAHMSDDERARAIGYAKEELIAEIGSAYLEAELGLAPSDSAQRASYVAGWLRRCESAHALAQAAAAAERAADWVMTASGVGGEEDVADAADEVA